MMVDPGAGPPTPNDASGSREEPTDDRSLRERLGVEVHYLPDNEAPPIDEARLLALIRHELSPIPKAETIHFVSTYRCWAKAWAEIARREAFNKK